VHEPDNLPRSVPGFTAGEANHSPGKVQPFGSTPGGADLGAAGMRLDPHHRDQPGFRRNQQRLAATGKVTRIGDLAGEGPVPVEVSLDQPLSPEVRAGDSADALIEYGRIENTLYMERGAFDKENADVAVFRVDPDKKHATRITVRFGAIGSELIEIKAGLREGDSVIVTDMSRWLAYERIRIQ